MFINFFTGRDSVTDSERVRILPSSSPEPDAARCEIRSSAEKDQQTDGKHREDAGRSRTGSFRRKSKTSDCEPYQMDSAFYNMGFSLSPSDLEQNWKQNRPSLKNNASDVGLRRTKSECQISIHRYPIDNSYIDKKCGPIPSDTSYKKVFIF